MINSIYVYDDKLIIICNVDNKPLTMTVNLLENIEENLGDRPFIEWLSSPPKLALRQELRDKSEE